MKKKKNIDTKHFLICGTCIKKCINTWDLKIDADPKALSLSYGLIYGIISCPHIIAANLSIWLGVKNLVFAYCRGHFFEINKSSSNVVNGLLLLLHLFYQLFLSCPPLLCEVFH